MFAAIWFDARHVHLTNPRPCCLGGSLRSRPMLIATEFNRLAKSNLRTLESNLRDANRISRKGRRGWSKISNNFHSLSDDVSREPILLQNSTENKVASCIFLSHHRNLQNLIHIFVQQVQPTRNKRVGELKVSIECNRAVMSLHHLIWIEGDARWKETELHVQHCVHIKDPASDAVRINRALSFGLLDRCSARKDLKRIKENESFLCGEWNRKWAFRERRESHESNWKWF